LLYFFKLKPCSNFNVFCIAGHGASLWKSTCWNWTYYFVWGTCIFANFRKKFGGGTLLKPLSSKFQLKFQYPRFCDFVHFQQFKSIAEFQNMQNLCQHGMVWNTFTSVGFRAKHRIIFIFKYNIFILMYYMMLLVDNNMKVKNDLYSPYIYIQ